LAWRQQLVAGLRSDQGRVGLSIPSAPDFDPARMLPVGFDVGTDTRQLRDIPSTPAAASRAERRRLDARDRPPSLPPFSRPFLSPAPCCIGGFRRRPRPPNLDLYRAQLPTSTTTLRAPAAWPTAVCWRPPRSGMALRIIGSWCSGPARGLWDSPGALVGPCPRPGPPPPFLGAPPSQTAQARQRLSVSDRTACWEGSARTQAIGRPLARIGRPSRKLPGGTLKGRIGCWRWSSGAHPPG